jgi:hypothetical protein
MIRVGEEGMDMRLGWLVVLSVARDLITRWRFENFWIL